MVSIKSTILASAVVAISAVNAANVTAEQTNDLLVIINDIESHISDYLSLETSGNSTFQVPPEVLSLYAQINTYTDETFTSLFTELDVSALTATITNLPWYSSRLLPALERANTDVATNETESATTSATASANETASITSSVSEARNSSSITHVSSSHSSTKSSSKNSTSTSHSGNSTSTKTSKSKKNAADSVGASSGLLFAGLAALLL